MHHADTETLNVPEAHAVRFIHGGKQRVDSFCVKTQGEAEHVSYSRRIMLVHYQCLFYVIYGKAKEGAGAFKVLLTPLDLLGGAFISVEKGVGNGSHHVTQVIHSTKH